MTTRMPIKLIDLTSQRFGRLIVREFAGLDGGGRGLWACDCDCGNGVVARSSTLRRGHRQSCGCLMSMVNRAANLAHGESNLSRSPEYRAWCGMKDRCQNPHNKAYPNYGGRGIKICARWDASFESFLADMGRRPSPIHSVDRENVNGDYEPTNCRWATPREQARNRRSCVYVQVGDSVLTLKDACAAVGAKYHLVQARMKRGHSFGAAIATPSRFA